jgi:hypothetical protein
MPLTSSTLSRLEKDFPNIKFRRGSTFRWAPAEQTVYFADPDDTTSLLHEVAHALLSHTEYTRDIELLEIERQAWDTAVLRLSKQYGISISEGEVEDMLDTYRDWLHSRSLCPTCEATGLQTDKNSYSCLACNTAWRVNEARSCALRRYKTK